MNTFSPCLRTVKDFVLVNVAAVIRLLVASVIDRPEEGDALEEEIGYDENNAEVEFVDSDERAKVFRGYRMCTSIMHTTETTTSISVGVAFIFHIVVTEAYKNRRQTRNWNSCAQKSADSSIEANGMKSTSQVNAFNLCI